MRKILYLGGFELPDKNAAAQRVMSNAKLLREMGFEVKLVGVSKSEEAMNTSVNGFHCVGIHYPKKISEWLYHVMTFLSKDEIEKYAPSYVVLYNFPAIASLKILCFCHQRGIKVIHDLTEWEQTYGYSFRSIIKRMDTQLRMHFCMKKMDGVIAISRYLYDYYKQYTNTILVPPTVDLYNEKWDRNRVLSVNNPKTLVYAGSPGTKEKDRLDRIVNAVVKFPNINLNVVGINQEQFENVYGKLATDYKNVSFAGRLPHIEAVKAVCRADFQMLIRDNTLKNTAGFPTKFAESISCSTPVIATLTSNIGDYLKDGVNGFIVDDNNTIEDVLYKISIMPTAAIIKMKRACHDFEKFDYRYYKNEFIKLFS